MTQGLSPTEYKLLSFMRAQGVGVEVDIAKLFREIVGPSPNPDHFDETRTMQQYVGAFVSRINAKQSDWKIKPGEKLKHTYCVQHKKSK